MAKSSEQKNLWISINGKEIECAPGSVGISSSFEGSTYLAHIACKFSQENLTEYVKNFPRERIANKKFSSKSILQRYTVQVHISGGVIGSVYDVIAPSVKGGENGSLFSIQFIGERLFFSKIDNP